MTEATLSPNALRLLSRASWITAALVVALGSAGLVTGLSHRPGTAARAELTYAADQAVRGPLEGIIRDLTSIALDFDALGAQGRAALAALIATDPDALDATVTVGDTLVERIRRETAAMRDRVAALPGTGQGEEQRLSAGVRQRVATVTQALDSTSGTAPAWATLSSGASLATRLTRLLIQHDESTGEAVRHGSQGEYTQAVQALDLSDPALAAARILRDKLANVADVSTLTQWLDRNAAIDVALRQLYTILEGTGGKVTDEARQAYDQVKQAQKQLPPDTRALVVIMSDIARAGLNQAVIKIEEARGRLADTIALLGPEPGTTPDAGESTAPGPSHGSPPPGATNLPDVTPPDA
jgi:hypothetical protein